MIAKGEEKYLLMTLDSNSGTEYYEYGIEDFGKVAVCNLNRILDQIEFEEEVSAFSLVACWIIECSKVPIFEKIIAFNYDKSHIEKVSKVNVDNHRKR